MSRTEGATARVRLTRKPYSVVPDHVLEARDLKATTRLILAWVLGRPNGWEYRIQAMLQRLGIKDTAWRSARKELIAGGWLTQIKQRQSNGTLVWINEFTDEPINNSHTPIRVFSTHGQTTRGSDTPKPISLNQYQDSPPPTPSISEATGNTKRGGTGGPSEDDLRDLTDAVLAQYKLAGRAVRDESALRQKIRRTRIAGLLPEDLDLLEAHRTARHRSTESSPSERIAVLVSTLREYPQENWARDELTMLSPKHPILRKHCD